MKAQHESYIEKYAKVGYITKGLVYITVGILTAMAAVGIGGKISSNSDAFKEIKQIPGGGYLLSLIAIGLIGYSLWRFIQAILDTEKKGKGAKGIGKRMAYTFSGLIYGSLATLAIKIGTQSISHTSGGSKEQNLLAEILEKPLGKWLAITVGMIIIGNGLYQSKKAYTKSFLKDVKGLPKSKYDFLAKSGQAGFAARGIVFSIIGALFMKAAWHQNPSEAEGTKGAFNFLLTSPFGSWLLAVVAVGLVCYGVFMFVQAKCSDISLN